MSHNQISPNSKRILQASSSTLLKLPLKLVVEKERKTKMVPTSYKHLLASSSFCTNMVTLQVIPLVPKISVKIFDINFTF